MRIPIDLPLPTGSSDRIFAPDDMAEEILNLQRTPSGTLASVVGPCPLVPNYGAGYPAQYDLMHGIYHAALERGQRDVLLVRSGDKLIEQRGRNRNFETLQSGLSSDPNARFPDQFAEIAGKVIWTNGSDRALVYDGYRLLPLGYSMTPSQPVPIGPTEQTERYRNGLGYSRHGRIGTAGDELSGQAGAMLTGVWYYQVQFEDYFGNLSPTSVAAGPVLLRSEQTADQAKGGADLSVLSVQLDDLTRQFLVTGIPIGPTGTVARWLFRTRDANRNPKTFGLVARIPDNVTTFYPDNYADSELGSSPFDAETIPTFKLVVVHAGTVYVANTTSNPGILQEMLPGTTGTPIRGRYVFPDPSGAELTGLASYQGKLYAFTDSTVFSITVTAAGLFPEPVSTGMGCVAPSSIKATGLGVLMWLGRDGFYSMSGDGLPQLVSEDLDKRYAKWNKSRLGRCVAVWNPNTKEYICAVPESGYADPNVLWCYDGKGWRKQDHGISYRALCVTRDYRQLLIGAGLCAAHDLEPNRQGVWVVDHEVRSYTPPAKIYRFRSKWIRPDPTGKQTFHVSSILVGFVESVKKPVTMRCYVNGRRDEVQFQSDSSSPVDEQLSMAPDDATLTFDTATLGTTSLLREPVLHWRKFDCHLVTASSFSFDVESTEPNHMQIAALSLDVTPNKDRNRQGGAG